jgi:excinuclease UvrABC nuclease subunit
MQEQHLVYTMYDKEMQPLYVGLTKNIKNRMYYHYKDKFKEGLSTQLNYIEITKRFSDRTEGLIFERAKILELKPLYNIQSKTLRRILQDKIIK